MVDTLITGIVRTGEGYNKHCKMVWIMALMVGFGFALISNSGMVITCAVVGIPAYLLYQGKKTTGNKKG